MLVTFEMSISAKDAQFLNAYVPMVVSVSGRLTVVNETQSLNI